MLQEIINELEEEIQECKLEADSNIGNALYCMFINNQVKAYLDAITLIRSKLPEFEEAIKKAWIAGAETCCADYPLPETPEDYYNQNYKK